MADKHIIGSLGPPRTTDIRPCAFRGYCEKCKDKTKVICIRNMDNTVTCICQNCQHSITR